MWWKLITHGAARSTDREGSLARLEPLAETEIGELHVKVLIQEDVFTL